METYVNILLILFAWFLFQAAASTMAENKDSHGKELQ